MENKEIKKEIELVKKSDIFKLIIPQEVEQKIRYVCSQIWKDEWSGTLFYKPEGTFEDGSLTIRCVDIYVMDIGTAAYTEFDMSPDVIGYMAENPKLLDCQMALIHSHNQMEAFFSQTDINTLKEEGKDKNHFVSLIVNNAGTYVAAITRKVKVLKTIAETYSYPTFEDEEIMNTRTYEVESEELEAYKLNIVFEGETQQGLKNRLEEIRRTKAEKAKQTPAVFTKRLKPESPFIPYGKYGEQEEPELPLKYNTKYNYDYEYMDGVDSQSTDIYAHIKFNKDTIKSLVLQLLTGSIIIPNTSKIDIRKWVEGMVPLYEKRFGTGEEGLKIFKAWAETYIEFLCWFSVDPTFEKLKLDDDESASICARDIIEQLNTLPKNVYINEYIDILKGYLLN